MSELLYETCKLELSNIIAKMEQTLYYANLHLSLSQDLLKSVFKDKQGNYYELTKAYINEIKTNIERYNNRLSALCSFYRNKSIPQVKVSKDVNYYSNIATSLISKSHESIMKLTAFMLSIEGKTYAKRAKKPKKKEAEPGEEE